ncbi:MAG TPA: hypothetical protein VNM14_06140 [Planctomycetota bacterium]|nr:hypothetical protein [Planctomycetota bacterium]
MSSPSRGRRALQIVAVLLAIPLLGAAGTWFWIQHTADRRWAEARVRIQQLSTLHPAELPPVLPTDVSKELQIHFVAAIREAARRNHRTMEAKSLVGFHQSDEALDPVLADAQDFLDRLHEGARRCAATPEDFPPGWRGEWDETTLRFVLNCCVLRARRWKQMGRAWEAAETTMDALQLGRFWAASGKGDNRRDALYALDRPLEDLRDLLSQEAFSGDQLLRIDRELEPLDAAWRLPSAYLEATLARWAEGLESRNLEESGILSDAPYRWRYLLPGHLMKAEAFEFYDRHIQHIIASESKSYLEMASAIDQLDRQERETKNPLVLDGQIISGVEWTVLERKAQLRLLRIAARYRATGEILPLKDPFGEQFRRRKAENRTTFWSPGRDGRDDGGDPAKDLVIEVIG